MKQVLVIAVTALFAFGCNNKTETKETTTDTTATASLTAEKFDYPYTLDKPYQEWQPGDQAHAVMVMKALKAYETGDIDACVSAFGDSVVLKFDGYHDKVSNDSLKKMFIKSRGDLADYQVKMGDWESVISKDKKEQYVTLWYKEIKTDKKGKTDSLAIVEDLKIENGKITLLDDKIQHFPAVKKN